MAVDLGKAYGRSFSTPSFNDEDEDKDDSFSDSSALSSRRKRAAFGRERSLTFKTMQAQVTLAQSLKSMFQSAAGSSKRGEDVDYHMEDAWLQAVYNAVVFALVGVVASIAMGVYFILEPFIYPILWAILLGTFLFPFKHSCTTRITLWLHNLECSAIPLCGGLFLSPFTLLGYLSSCLDDLMVAYWRQFVFLMGTMATFYLFFQFNLLPILSLVLRAVGGAFEGLGHSLSLLGPVVLMTVLAAFLLLVLVFQPSLSRSWLLLPLSVVVWFVAICSMAKCLLGTTGLSISILFFAIASLTYVIRSKARKTTGIPSDSGHSLRRQSTIMEVITDRLDEFGISRRSPSPSADDLPHHKSVTFQDEHVDLPVGVPSEGRTPDDSSDEDEGGLSPLQEKRSFLRKSRTSALHFEKKERTGSNQVFLLLMTCCLIRLLWSQPWLLLLISPLLIWHLARKILNHLSLHQQWWAMRKALAAQTLPSMEVLWPEPLPTLLQLCLDLDRWVLQIFRLSLGGIMSAGIIVGLLVGSLALSAFLVFQIQLEVSYTIGMATQILNTSVNNSWIVRLSGGAVNSSSDLHDTMEQFANYSFHYGRDWLATQVQQVMGDAGKDSVVVDQVIEIYDSFYHSYVLKNDTSVFKSEQQTENVEMDMWNAAIVVISQNLNAVLSVLKSLWSILFLNLSIAASVVTFLSVLVFSGGTLLLNFVVFFTVLFYLLCYSEEHYLPVQWVVSALPDFINSSENDYPETLSRVIQSVFHASVRRAGFYSLYTWLVLSVLGIQMTILPSVLAGLAGAVPFVGPYWVGLPAILQLWLVEEQVGVALLALALFLMPPFLIDSIINSEIEGSHPYLTGLAIVGGVYYAGLGGALIGPILLCCLLFVINVITEYL